MDKKPPSAISLLTAFGRAAANKISRGIDRAVEQAVNKLYFPSVISLGLGSIVTCVGGLAPLYDSSNIKLGVGLLALGGIIICDISPDLLKRENKVIARRGATEKAQKGGQKPPDFSP